LLREDCLRAKSPGVVFITNVRLLWRREGSTLYELNTNLLHVDSRNI